MGFQSDRDLNVKSGWCKQMKTIPLRDYGYWETAKGYLAKSTLHGLPWVFEDLPRLFKERNLLSPLYYIPLNFMQILVTIYVLTMLVITLLSFRETVVSNTSAV